MSIEKHKCEGGDFHTTTDFLECECGAVTPNVTQLSKAGNDIVFCAGCGTEFAPEDLPDARVEEIVKAFFDAADTSKTVPENCVAIGESRMLELEEKEAKYDKILEAMEQVKAIPIEEDGEDAEWDRSGSESEEALCRVVRLVRAALGEE